MEAILASLAGTAASNAMSEWHADKQMNREKQLMNKQNAMNRANALDAYSQQVQGARLAGLSPAMLNGQPPTIAPAVSKGSVSQAENVEFDPATMLLDAQRENVEADTDKKKAETAKISGVDTENTKADTQAKQAAKLLTEAQTTTEGNKPDLVKAQTENTEAEAQRIKNINQAFAEENSAMGLFGQTMAQNWQKEPWYNKLSNGSKMVIDDIAKGNLDLTVGIASALNKSIDTDQNMNETEKNKFEYNLTEKVIQAQLKDPKVMKALAKIPSAQYNKLIAEATKLGVETKLLKFDYDWNKEKKDVWEKNDPDKLYAEYQKDPTWENAAKWLVSSMRNTGVDVIKGTAGPAAGGYMAGRGLKSGNQGSSMNPKDKSGHYVDQKKQGKTFFTNGLGDWTENQGVQQMKK